MKRNISITINGDSYEFVIEPWQTLLEVIREQAKLTGVKESCGTGGCGNCLVILEGKPVNSCIVLAVDADGKDIMTIEGLANGETLHPIQQAFIDHGAIQCGYCTPGMILGSKALLDKNPNPTKAEIEAGMEGILCRCTGYVKIVDAIIDASENMNERN